MNPVTVSATGNGTATVVSRVVVPDFLICPFNLSVGCVGSGAVTYTVQHTYDDTLSSTFDATTATWFNNATIVTKTGNNDVAYSAPVRGLRASLASASTGTLQMTIIQASNVP